ncbi:MAG: chromosomal replication initiator protein DnaA [Cardiobacteriaceae bacterium]|nr:chromosomal replication initiator protein DnaA [Cardiobacteriaceae bacterium]
MSKSAKVIWENCLDNMSYLLPEDDISTLRTVQLREDAGQWQLVAISNPVRSKLQKEYMPFIEKAFKKVAPEIKKPKIVMEEPDLFAAPRARPAGGQEVFKSHLIPDYQFDNFVSGPSNDQAFAAARRVGAGALDFNPLVIYGGTGLGKSHLMHATGNALKRLGNKRVMYVTAETFVNDFTRTLHDKTKSMEDFAAQYRNVDALLIDDVQFLGGKERSQTEFFHTFNSLFDRKCQIVLTCDRFPKEIEGLEERLKSRFGSGLSVSVAPPELETRIAILQTKAEKFDFALPDDVAMFIASHIVSNVRELEGALRSVYARCLAVHQPASIAIARDALKDHIKAQSKQVSMDDILKTVGKFYKVGLDDILGKSRKAKIALARQVGMMLAKELTTHSYPDIGRAFGDRDHTTVIHACRKVEKLREEDKDFEEEYKGLRMMLTG